MRSEDYEPMLENHLRPQALEKVGRDFVFQQDCASVHTAKIIKDWFRAKKVRYLDWPSKSPDLNDGDRTAAKRSLVQTAADTTDGRNENKQTG